MKPTDHEIVRAAARLAIWLKVLRLSSELGSEQRFWADPDAAWH